MQLKELAKQLNKIKIATEYGENNTIYFLFTVLFYDEMKKIKEEKRLDEFMKASNLKKSFKTEIYKGLKLAPYIELKSETKAKLREYLQ